MKRKNADGTAMCNRGDKNPASKLKEADIPTIRHRLSQGDSQTNIARTYGVSPSAIGLIANNINWVWCGQ
jgi:hypothetical protein